MKFGAALESNTLEEWKDYYIKYTLLKKQLDMGQSQFLSQLQEERTLIVNFYNTILEHIENMASMTDWEQQFKFLKNPTLSHSKKPPLTISINHFHVLPIDHSHSEEDLIEYYQYMCHLENYANLNFSGLRKICKKYDKQNNTNISEIVMSQVKQDAWTTNDTLEHLKSAVVSNFALLIDQSEDYSLNYLNKKMTDLVVYTKNTVWRDMTHPTVATTKNWQDHLDYQFNRKSVFKATCHFSIFNFLLFLVPLLPIVTRLTDKPYQANCFGVLFSITYLWATEAIPLFVTSLLVPLLLVTRHVLVLDGQVLAPNQSAQLIFSHYFYSPIVPLLLGGFTLASALSKYRILQPPCDATLKWCNHSTYKMLFVLMNLTTFISGIISNVAAPVLCTSLIHSLLKRVPLDSRIAKALLLGIAMSSNVGGMITPISSPQNIITIHFIQKSWVEWLLISVPICLICNLLIFVIILLIVKPHAVIPTFTDATALPTPQESPTSEHSEHSGQSEHSNEEHAPLLPRNTSKRPFTSIYDPVQWVILISSCCILSLWIIAPLLSDYLSSSIISLIPILFYFGCQFLDKSDFNDLLWHVIVLAQGGMALGHAIENTGCLALMTHYLLSFSQHLSSMGVFIMLSGFTLVVASMISHTVAALIVLPIVSSIGKALELEALMVMGIGLICSSAMALPISGFPNMHIINVEDPLTGLRYLSIKDMIKVGIVSSIACMIVICTLGVVLMSSVLK